MALVYLDADPWLAEHEAREKLYREIMEQLTVRSRERKTSQALLAYRLLFDYG
jgi:hypothetical protein